MKALIFDKSKNNWETTKGFELAEIPEPVLGVGDEGKVILKVHYAGVCGTDRGIWNRMAFKDAILGSIDQEATLIHKLHANNVKINTTSPHPSPHEGRVAGGRGGLQKSYRILGHEFFGEIKDKGSNVKDFNIGDMVACESHVVCNECFQCKNGQKNVCINEKILGISVDGGFAEYAKVPAQVLWKVDTHKIREEVAVLHEPFGNAVHAASKVNLKDKTVAIFGLGPIAQFLILILKGMGAKTIIGIEPNEKAMEMAEKLGIDHAIKYQKSNIKNQNKEEIYKHNENIVDTVKKLTNGLGVDIAFEMAGFNDSVNNAIASVRRGGDVILFGLKAGDFMFEDYNKLVMKGITMHCVAGRQLWETWKTTQKLFEDKNNGIADGLFNVLLNKGEGTILNIEDYSKEKFEDMMQNNPKILIKF